MKFPTLVLLLFMAVSPMLRAQDDADPFVLPRVGAQFDSGETEYFLLFPASMWTSRGPLENISPDAIWLREGMFIPMEYEVRQCGRDSVTFHRDSTSEHGPLAVTISRRAALALAFYLERFEEIRETMRPYEIRSGALLPDSLQDAAEELFETGVLSDSWPEWSGRGRTNPITVRTRDGRVRTGKLLALTSRKLILWTGDMPITDEAAESALQVIAHSEVDSFSLQNKERLSGIATGLIVSGMAWGQINFGAHYNEIEGDALVLAPLTLLLSVVAGTSLGTLFPVSREAVIEFDSTRSSRFGSSPLFKSITLRPGLAPEIHKRLTLEGEEHILRWENERVPYVPGPGYLQRLRSDYAIAGIEQLWLSATGIQGVRFGATLGYEHTFYDIPRGIGGIAAGVLVSGGQEYGTAGVHAMARIGPFRFRYGLRAVFLPGHINTSSPYPHGNNRDHTVTTVTHLPTTAGHYLYSDLGFELLVWNLVIGMHFLQQSESSVTTHTVSSRYYEDFPTYESYTRGIDIGAIALSIRLRI